MKIKKYIVKVLIPIVLLNTFSLVSNAENLSYDTRYETFEYLHI